MHSRGRGSGVAATPLPPPPLRRCCNSPAASPRLILRRPPLPPPWPLSVRPSPAGGGGGGKEVGPGPLASGPPPPPLRPLADTARPPPAGPKPRSVLQDRPCGPDSAPERLRGPERSPVSAPAFGQENPIVNRTPGPKLGSFLRTDRTVLESGPLHCRSGIRAALSHTVHGPAEEGRACPLGGGAKPLPRIQRPRTPSPHRPPHFWQTAPTATGRGRALAALPLHPNQHAPLPFCRQGSALDPTDRSADTIHRVPRRSGGSPAAATLHARNSLAIRFCTGASVNGR